MKNIVLSFITIAALSSASFGCNLLKSVEVYDYEADPQEIAQDFGTQAGMFPEVDCTASDQLCAAMGATLPSNATVACEAAASGSTKHCVAHYDLTVYQTIDLAKQASFPSAVLDSPAVSLVTLDTVRYWTSSPQTFNTATPPLDIYVGDANTTAPTDKGVQKLGTIGSIPALKPPSAKPDCTNGEATSKETACDMQLTDAGKELLETLAKSFQTPFSILVVGHLTASGGEPLPGGKVDLFVEPVIGFHL
jgi:hypothetical protein